VLEEPPASVAVTVTVAVTFLPRRRARRTARSVFPDSFRRRVTCLPVPALRETPLRFSARLAPGRDTGAEGFSVQGAPQLPTTMIALLASTCWMPAAASNRFGLV